MRGFLLMLNCDVKTHLNVTFDLCKARRLVRSGIPVVYANAASPPCPGRAFGNSSNLPGARMLQKTRLELSPGCSPAVLHHTIGPFTAGVLFLKASMPDLCPC